MITIFVKKRILTFINSQKLGVWAAWARLKSKLNIVAYVLESQKQISSSLLSLLKKEHFLV